MSFSISIPQTGDKSAIYEAILPQIAVLLKHESDLIANMGNTVAVLKEAFGWFWVGFYVVKSDQLVLSAFQGTVACTRIGRGRGVCGAAWERAQTVVVPDVAAFAGHIACSSLTQSEIVVPCFGASGEVWAVLDIDSERLAAFDEIDAHYLQKIVALI